MNINANKPRGPYNQLKLVEYTKWKNGGMRIEAIYILSDGVTEVPIANIFTTYDETEKKWSHVVKDMAGNDLTLPTATDYLQKNYLKENARRLMEERLMSIGIREEHIVKQQAVEDETDTIDNEEDAHTKEEPAKGKDKGISR